MSVRLIGGFVLAGVCKPSRVQVVNRARVMQSGLHKTLGASAHVCRRRVHRSLLLTAAQAYVRSCSATVAFPTASCMVVHTWCGSTHTVRGRVGQLCAAFAPAASCRLSQCCTMPHTYVVSDDSAATCSGPSSCLFLAPLPCVQHMPRRVYCDLKRLCPHIALLLVLDCMHFMAARSLPTRICGGAGGGGLHWHIHVGTWSREQVTNDQAQDCNPPHAKRHGMQRANNEKPGTCRSTRVCTELPPPPTSLQLSAPGPD